MGASVQPEPTPQSQTAFQAALAAAKKPVVSGPTLFQSALEKAKSGAAPTDEAPWYQKAAEAVVSGFPGAQRAVAGYRGIGALLHGESLGDAANEVQSSLQNERKDVAATPFIPRTIAQIAGGGPAASIVAPLGLVGGGAALGSAYGVDQPAANIGERAKNTLLGGIVGGATSGAAKLVGKGISNLAERSGAADAIQGILSKYAPKTAATLGTEGQVNQALADRQDILDKIGDTGDTGAKLQLERIANNKAKANALYNLARQDKSPIQDLKLNELLADPQIQKAFNTASNIRAASGNPLPTVEAPEQVPLALQKMGVTQERYNQLQALNQSRRIGISGTEVLPPELLGEQSKGVELPDPDVIAKTKRYLMDAAMGRQNSPLAMNQDEAQALLPKVNAIRDRLHTLSPAWKNADQFYSNAKGQEEAFASGFDSFKKAGNQSGDNLAENSPEAMQKAISEPRFPNEKPEALAARQNAFKEGARAAAIGQVKDQPVDRGIKSILGVNALEPTQPGMQSRSLMFDNPEQSTNLESLLAQLRGKSMAMPSGQGSNIPPASTMQAMRYAIRKLSTSPDLLQTPKGQQLLIDRLSSPGALQAGADASRQGNAALAPMLRMLGIDLGNQGER